MRYDRAPSLGRRCPPRLWRPDRRRPPRPRHPDRRHHDGHRAQRVRQVDPAACARPTAALRRPVECCSTASPISSMRTRDVARVLGVLPQSPTAPEGLTVADLVARGRHPHQSWIRQWSADDADEVAVALRRTGIADLADRRLDQLSGGQRQRAWISMALAQGTDILLLDEPTTYLDLAHSIEVLDLVDELHEELGRTVVMVLHDLNLAIRYSDHLVVMSTGRDRRERSRCGGDLGGVAARRLRPRRRRHRRPGLGSPPRRPDRHAPRPRHRRRSRPAVALPAQRGVSGRAGCARGGRSHRSRRRAGRRGRWRSRCSAGPPGPG